MEKFCVIYQSKYGTTARYAHWVAGQLQAPIFEASQVSASALKDYEVVIYGAPLYTGRILEAKSLAKSPIKQLVLFTVGIFDPATTDYAQILKRSQLSPLKTFHFRGGIDYQKLSGFHRFLNWGLHKFLAKKSSYSPEEQAFLETYQQTIDYSDETTVLPLIEYIQSL